MRVHHRSFIQFIKFGVVGVMNTGVDFLTYSILLLLGVHYLAAQVAAYAVGTVNSYIMNRLWTFRNVQAAGATQLQQTAVDRSRFLRFAVLNTGTLLMSLLILFGLKSGLGIPALTAKVIVTGFTVIVNFTGSKLWVFR